MLDSIAAGAGRALAAEPGARCPLAGKRHLLASDGSRAGGQPWWLREGKICGVDGQVEVQRMRPAPAPRAVPLAPACGDPWWLGRRGSRGGRASGHPGVTQLVLSGRSEPSDAAKAVAALRVGS